MAENRQNLLRELLVEIREKRKSLQARVKKYALIIKAIQFLLSFMNVVTLIVLVLVLSIENEQIAVICSLVNHALMFLFSHLSDSSGFKETFNTSKHVLEEFVALDRDLSLILSRNHLSEQDTKDVWCNSVDKLASLEQRIIE